SLSLSVEAFHERCRMRASAMPHALLATSTHDSKRGEDARARLAVLSEIPELWREAVSRWYALNARWRPDGLAADDEYMLYQALLGAWPDPRETQDEAFLDRILVWRRKSLREAKLRSSWTSPSESYEALNRDFVRALLDPARGAEFLADIAGFIAEIDAAAR